MTFLMHDTAFRTAVEILRKFSGVLREEEERDAFWEIYECVRQGLREYEINADRRMRRLYPGRN